MPSSTTALSGSLKNSAAPPALRLIAANRRSRQSAMPLPGVGTTVSRLRKLVVSDTGICRPCAAASASAAGMSGVSMKPKFSVTRQKSRPSACTPTRCSAGHQRCSWNSTVSSCACWCRSTAKRPRGGTKAKLKASTVAALASSEVHGPDQGAASAALSTSTSALFARSRRSSCANMPAQPSAPMAKAGQCWRGARTSMDMRASNHGCGTPPPSAPISPPGRPMGEQRRAQQEGPQ